MASKVDITIKAKDEASGVIDGINDSFGGLGDGATEASEISSDAFGDIFDSAMTAFVGINQGIELAIKAFDLLKGAYEGTVGKALDIAGEIEELMRVSGEAPEKLSALRIEAEKADVPFDDLYKAMENLNKNGVAPTIDNLVAIADEYVRLQDPIAQATLLTENFGSAGDEIAPMLEAIAGGVTAVQDAGLIFTEEEIQAAKDYEAAMAGLKQTWDEFTIAIGTEIIPALTELIDSFGSLELDGGGIGGFFKKEVESISKIALQFQLAGIAAESFKDKEINLIEYGKALWTAFGSATTTTADLREEITNLGGHFDDLTMRLFDQSTSFADFKNKMDDAGLSIGILDEATYNAEKGFESLSTAIDKVPEIKTIEVEANDGPVKAKLEELARMGIEDKSFDVIAELDTSDVDGYQPLNKVVWVETRLLNDAMDRAAGGVVNAAAGVAAGLSHYWVGERGPEPFFPSVDGRIVSNTQAMSALRGGAGVNSREIANAVREGVKDAMRETKAGNVYNLTMPTSNNPADVRTAFELMEAWA